MREWKRDCVRVRESVFDCVGVLHVSTACARVLMRDVAVSQKLTWRSGQGDRDMCAVKGKHRVSTEESTELKYFSSVPTHGNRLGEAGCLSNAPLILCLLLSGRVPQLHQSAGSQKRRPGVHLWYQWLQPHVQILQGKYPRLYTLRSLWSIFPLHKICPSTAPGIVWTCVLWDVRPFTFIPLNKFDDVSLSSFVLSEFCCLSVSACQPASMCG